MVLTETPKVNFDTKLHDFSLRSTDETIITLKDVIGKNGILIMFICNHCPYVKAIIENIIETAAMAKKNDFGVVAIMPNDFRKYKDDNFENMKDFAKKNQFNFPYIIDEKQDIAKKYRAVCTPDFFCFNKYRRLQYRGRITALKNLKPIMPYKNELMESINLIIKTNKGPIIQYPSIGCSIKWK